MFLLTLVASQAFAAPLSPLQGMPDRGTVVLAPGVGISSEGSVSPATYLGASLAPVLDVNIGVGADVSWVGDGSTPFVDFMPRLFPTESLGLGARIMYDGSGELGFGAEAHHVFEKGRFTLTSNLGWHGANGLDGFSAGDVFAMIAPEISVHDRFSLFVEVNPTVTVSAVEESGVDLVPGVCATLDRDGNHQLTLGVAVPARSAPEVGVGLVWSATLGASTTPVQESGPTWREDPVAAYSIGVPLGR